MSKVQSLPGIVRLYECVSNDTNSKRSRRRGERGGRRLAGVGGRGGHGRGRRRGQGQQRLRVLQQLLHQTPTLLQSHTCSNFCLTLPSALLSALAPRNPKIRVGYVCGNARVCGSMVETPNASNSVDVCVKINSTASNAQSDIAQM